MEEKPANSSSEQPGAGNVDLRGAQSVTAENVTIRQGGAGTVQAKQFELHQGGAQSVTADNVTIRQGGAFNVKTQHLEIHQGGVGLARTETAQLTAAAAGAVLARGDVALDMTAARFLLAPGGVSMNQSGSVVLISREVKAERSGVVFLLAGKVEGVLNPVFGPRESVIFGVVAGIVAGLIAVFGRKARRREA